MLHMMSEAGVSWAVEVTMHAAVLTNRGAR